MAADSHQIRVFVFEDKVQVRLQDLVIFNYLLYLFKNRKKPKKNKIKIKKYKNLPTKVLDIRNISIKKEFIELSELMKICM